MRKPLPADYGLPTGYSWAANKTRIESREALVQIVGGIGGMLIACAVGALVINHLYRAIGNYALLALPVVIVGGIGLIGLLITRVLTPRFVDANAGHAKRYGEALEAFEYHNLETGIGFWQTMRGIAFEQAIMKLFNARGCRAQMTKTTGDGGVDVRLTIGTQSYWCQCKGHAKPIGVAPIREIAGVCSKGVNRPVVLAVNGYTKPAQEAARQLGVRLIDANHITALARMTRIDHL